MTFEGLCRKYHTDKLKYAKAYKQLFKRFGTPGTILEIGVDTGASLMLWRDLFPGTVVCGTDVSTANLNDDVHAHVFIAGQHQSGRMEEIAYMKWDVVIDDAGHWYPHQKICFDTVAPYSKLYIVEDVAEKDLEKWCLNRQTFKDQYQIFKEQLKQRRFVRKLTRKPTYIEVFKSEYTSEYLVAFGFGKPQ